WSQLSVTLVRFQPEALAAYAASIVPPGSSGPGADPLGAGASAAPDWRSLFVGWRPKSAGMARYCRATARHVLTAVLAGRELADAPVGLHAAFGPPPPAPLATFPKPAAPESPNVGLL